MAISLLEAETALLSGRALAWKKFGAHKAGSIILDSPEKRRLLKFLLLQSPDRVSQGDENLFEGLVDTWKNVEFDPASEIQESVGTAFSGSWLLERVETFGFGGLNQFNGPPFDLWVEGESWCLEGQNGSGKTSLASAILWALTGKKIREQDGPVEDQGQRSPVTDRSGKEIGTWPALAAYPSTRDELKKDAEIWVRLTFRNQKSESAIAYRRVHSPFAGEPKVDVHLDANLYAAPQLIETGLLMPVRMGRIGFGDKSQSLYEAVKSLTGLDQLNAIAEGVAIFTHAGRRFLKYAKDQGGDQQQRTFDDYMARAEQKAKELSVDVSKVKTLGQPGLSEKIREIAAQASADAGKYLASLKSDLAADLDTASPESRVEIGNAVATVRVLLAQGTKGVPTFEAWAALRTASDDDQFLRLPQLLTLSKVSLERSLVWHKRQTDDRKLRLKALASQFYVDPKDATGQADCPLCDSPLSTVAQLALASELEELRKDAEVAERRIDDVCVAIEAQLQMLLLPELKTHFELLSRMEPRESYALAAVGRFAADPSFKDILVGMASFVREVVARQKEGLPAFNFEQCDVQDEGLPSVIKCRRAFASFERLLALVKWWSEHRDSFRDAWIDLVGKRAVDGNWPPHTVGGRLSALEQALEKAEPLDELSKSLTAAAKAVDSWDKIQVEQKIRESIAVAVESMKEFRFLVGAETASSISSLSERMTAIRDRIHLSERLTYEEATLGKKAVHVSGSFDPDMRIDAALVANTSWLRAILWAFILALREQTIQGLGANPFPLMVLDDPQMTFDPRNKRKWAEELVRHANAEQDNAHRMQLFMTTHERQFFQCVVHHEKLNGRQGLVAAVNKISRVATVVNGGCLERIWKEAIAENSDPLARKYISAVRIYSEDLLKFMLRGEGPVIADLSLDGLKKELKKRQDAHVPPFDRKPFVDLSNTLGGGGGKAMILINESHHKDDESIGVGDAMDVKAFWQKTFQKQIHEAFVVYADYEAFRGEPRTFAWEETVVELPEGFKEAIEAITLMNTGVAAAAKTRGRAGDGILTLEEWEAAEPITLHNHGVFQLAAGTLDPVAAIGDLLIVSNYAKVGPTNLVVVAFGKKLLVRRLNLPEGHPEIAVLTGQAVDPLDLPQPIIVPLKAIKPLKIVGTVFAANQLATPARHEDKELLAIEDAAILNSTIDKSRLFRVKGRSAEPIALDGQFLMTLKTTLDIETLKRLDGRLIVGVDENGVRYFKRLRYLGSIAVLESLNPDGTSPAEILSIDAGQAFPMLKDVLEVIGVLFELPGAKKQPSNA